MTQHPSGPQGNEPSEQRGLRGPLKVSLSPGGDRPDATDGPFVIERTAALAHEMRNLLDGSLRTLGLAKRAAVLLPATVRESEQIVRYLDTASLAMERMADLVNAAMRGSGSVIGRADLCPSAPITLHEAIRHAVDVITPEAQERAIRIDTRLDQVAGRMPVGPLYSVLLNALRNSIEAIPQGEPGLIQVEASWMPDPAAERDGIKFVILTVSDDGRGAPAEDDPQRVFDFGFSTKPGRRGVGLALAREIIREAGGSIEFAPRHDRPPGPRRGAVLRVVYPSVERPDRSIG